MLVGSQTKENKRKIPREDSKRKFPSERSQAKYPTHMFLNEGSESKFISGEIQANDPKLEFPSDKVPSERSQARDPKRKFQSEGF